LALNEGLFDQLMKSVEFHLDKEYKQSRLRGTEYAKVYVGAIQGVMQYTTQYLLGTMLITEQRDKAKAEISLITSQENLIDEQIAMSLLEQERIRYEIDTLLPLQATKLQSEIDVLDNQVLKITAEIAHLVVQQALIVKQGLKVDQEILFLIAKVVTENANTQSGIAASGSLIGKQMSLLTAQKLGFSGDLQVKSAKLFADYDAVFQSVQETPGAATLGNQAVTAIGQAQTTASAIAGV